MTLNFPGHSSGDQIMENKVRWPCVSHGRDDTYGVLVGKPEGKSLLGISGVGCENITEIEQTVVEPICLGLVNTVINFQVLKLLFGLLK